jgi:transcriptional regulator with XRE-family HTH domain
MDTFAEKVKRRRESLGFSQKELAGQMGVSSKIIYAYERGSSKPRGITVHKLARALDVAVEYLLDDEIDDPNHGMAKDAFVAETWERYGARAAREAGRLLESNIALFAGGALEQDEKDQFFAAVTKAYWEAKEDARRVFGRKG